ELLEKAKPAYVLINASRKDIVDGWIELHGECGAGILTSYDNGAVTIRFTRQGISAKSFLTESVDLPEVD
ncbi:MAG: hypothetical protein HY762_00935, partial [Planctomycetes bacterium]|nr:hypothetical protein [Planctomycetota bacterium]